MSVVLLLDYAISQCRTASDPDLNRCLHERQADEKVVISFSQSLPIAKLWPKVKMQPVQILMVPASWMVCLSLMCVSTRFLLSSLKKVLESFSSV
jgi:hypothetical protein